MCDRRKLLLAAIVFYYKVTAGSPKLLDMAPDAVDYVYDECRKEAMETFIHSGLLQKELNASEGFQRAWSAKTSCSKLIPGGTKEHTAALLAYADGEAEFTETFDIAVETTGGNVSTYENHFHFKSLHFLLMDSMSLPNPKEKCKIVHFLTDKYTAQKGSKMRFGKFTKVHSSYSAAQSMTDLDDQVIFNITSCFFVNLGDDICSEDQGMVLLSPAEVFTVEAVNVITDERNDAEYTEIVLKHSELKKSDNCKSLSRSPADGSTQWLVLMLVALSLFFFNY
ncbi:ecto-ADP-ribosyltransferase 5 isoform X2 [Sebastes umbrosus]|nr:ecto-ADP-ribosyltransferase 5 isoform X2 [Sebastes umbrosus]XP_037621397.1 ecto-ADP-ribosyltransferase 5 isoform X2 [Sebastes umbrosus]XP_037621398.1 ecto-ADP-ribosyltransferase 5 isoform X2 [Sebastes umbrosus]XP_037621399.1 ecto-ADP-ribosyltransferase 5 isoform X2 [Sebastes umbrosus]